MISVVKNSSPPEPSALPARSSAPGHALRSALRAAFWTLTALALPAALLTTAAYFSNHYAVLAQLSPFRVQYAALLAAHALFCLVLGRRRWSALFVAFALLNAGAVLHATRSFPAPAGPPSDPGRSAAPLKILYANVLTSNTDPAPLLALIATEKPDLVALLEINARWKARLLAALAADFPHHSVHPREDNFGLAIFSRAIPGGGRVEFFADVETPSIDLTWFHPDADIRMVLTHPLPPGDERSNFLRNQHLEDLAKWRRFVAGLAPSGAPPQPVLILGDLNATPWCPPVRRLLSETGLRPAAGDAGLLAPTWPVPIPFLRIPLDHALISPELACVSYRVGPDIGSDHFPLLLEVSPVASP